MFNLIIQRTFFFAKTTQNFLAHLCPKEKKLLKQFSIYQSKSKRSLFFYKNSMLGINTLDRVFLCFPCKDETWIITSLQNFCGHIVYFGAEMKFRWGFKHMSKMISKLNR